MCSKVKMTPVSKVKFTRALRDHGYTLDRTNGGHETWEKVITKTCTIPSHGNDISAPLAKRLSKEHNLDLF